MRLPRRGAVASRYDEAEVAHRRSRVPPTGEDVLGLTLFATGAAWSYVAAAVSGGEPGPVAMLFLASGAAFLMARAAASISRTLVPGLILGIGVALLAGSGADALSKHPQSGPFGYSNATAAFFVQVTMAALMLSEVVRRRSLKGAAVVAAVAFALVPLAVGSRAAAFLVLALPLIAFALQLTRGARAAVTCCAVLFAASMTTTSLLAAWYSDDARSTSAERVVEEVLTERRLMLWHEAIVLMAQHPVTGVGPGRFAEVSPAARFDRDTKWAHQGFLQQGAEAGLPGFLILLLLFGWAFSRLRAVAAGVATVPGAAAVAALGIQACFDYVLHFAAVPIAAAALLGAAIGQESEEERA